MKFKTCTKCKEEKELSEFYKDKYKPDGHRPDCKECNKLQCENYVLNNREYILDYKKEWNKDNEEKVNSLKKEYHEKFPWLRRLAQIKQRCNNTNNSHYKDYGLRGIKCLITEEELKFLWYRDKAYNMKSPSI